jgi:hypothetical protein
MGMIINLVRNLTKVSPNHPEFFDEIDADKDQKISREELEN